MALTADRSFLSFAVLHGPNTGWRVSGNSVVHELHPHAFEPTKANGTGAGEDAEDDEAMAINERKKVKKRFIEVGGPGGVVHERVKTAKSPQKITDLI